MINQEELAICRRRKHNIPYLISNDKWSQCKSCVMWLREKTTIEEREDTPPDDEIHSFHKLSVKFEKGNQK